MGSAQDFTPPCWAVKLSLGLAPLLGHLHGPEPLLCQVGLLPLALLPHTTVKSLCLLHSL